MSRLRGWLQRVVRESLQDELDAHRRAVDVTMAAALDEMQTVISTTSEYSERMLAVRDDDLAKLLVRVAESMETMVTQLDAQSQDLRVYLAKTEMLMRELVLAGVRNEALPGSTPSTIVGGSIEGRSMTSGDLYEIDLRDALVPGAAVEVRSHFQGRWMSGFRVLDVVSTDDGPLYRVERRYDHSALPVLFGGAEIRPVVEPTTRDDVPLSP